MDDGYPKGIEEEKSRGLFVVPAVIYAGKGVVFVSFGVAFLRERMGMESMVKGEGRREETYFVVVFEDDGGLMVLDGEVGDDGWERVCGLSIEISDDAVFG